MRNLHVSFCLLVTWLFSYAVNAQCASGYGSGQLNWDNLSYHYYTTTNGDPYKTYITTSMAETQKFAFGRTWAQFDVGTGNYAIVKGSNSTNTCDIAGYTGDDVQYKPTAANQKITITFGTDISNVSFALYSIDASQKISLTAKNSSNTSQNITATFQSSTILGASGNGGTNPSIIASSTTLTNNADNRGTATIKISGTVNQIVLTIAIVGSAPDFWLSDINACVPNAFPTNYHQQTSVKPFTNQPDYFITTPDNNSAYMVDPSTGKAYHLFTDASNTYINSFAYDQKNKILYYIAESSSANANNKQLKKYDFNSETISIVYSDIVTSLGIPTFDQGIQSAGAAFYDDALYLGIEGGSGRKSIIWRIDFDVSLAVTNVAQVFATPAYVGTTSLHDWGDFMVKDGVLVDFNTARQGTSTFTYPNSSFIHFDLVGGSRTTYTNPNSTTAYTGQAGLNWKGDMYAIRNVIEKYNMDGTKGTSVPITVVRGPAWIGNAGDASEPFKPKMDFGDAPSSYDPSTGDPAVHEIDTTLRLGANVDKEWVTRGQSILANSDNYDDGLYSTQIFSPSAGNYLNYVYVYNHTGANATVCAWLDYNGNGVFDPSEGISVTVPSSTATQTVALYWPSITSSLTNGTYTYLRIRVTYASNGMTVNNPTGYYNAGEVEDYRIPVNTYALTTQLFSFTATKTPNKKVSVKWKVEEDNNTMCYRLQKSCNGVDWITIATKQKTGGNALQDYEVIDAQPRLKNYYRLQIVNVDASTKQSDVREVNFDMIPDVVIAPNPAKQKVSIMLRAESRSTGWVNILTMQGVLLYKQQVALLQGDNVVPVNISSFSAGNYLIQIIKDGKTTTQKLIIE
ncbi:MAG: hypothetical protein C4330_04080 [Chitinophagaceae bacterium]